MTKTKSNKLISWYQKIPSGLKTKYENPSFDNIMISHPFRMGIIGSSGAGKSTLVLEIIHRMNGTFGNITLCCQNADEPLYKFLSSKIKPEQLQIFEGYENIPPLDALDKECQHLVIFDDLVLQRRQDKIEEYFIRGRKIAKGVSMIYLTQSYWKVPKVIRLQWNFIILKKLSSTKDLKMIMNDFSLGIDKEILLKLYKKCTEEKGDFLLVDLDTDIENRFRFNFLEILNISDFI